MAWSVKATDDQVRLDPQMGRIIERGATAGVGPRRGVIHLRAARNEYVSFQLAIGPLSGRERRFTVTCSDLAGPARLSRRDVEVYRSWYIKVGNRWYPEALIPTGTDGEIGAPDRTNRVPRHRFQGLWVDLWVPAEAPAGRYAGTVAVSDGRREVELALNLEVADFAIPDECSLLCDLNNYVDGISAGWPDLADDVNRHRKARYRRIEAGFFRAAHEHRACLHYLPYLHSSAIPPTFAPPLAGHGRNKRITSWTEFDRHFGGYLDGTAFRGTRRGPIPVPRFWMPLNLNWPADFERFGRPGYAAEWRAVGRQIVDHFRQKGWTRTSFDLFINHKQRYRFFPWDCEEVRFAPDNAIHYHFRDLWRGTYDWPNTKPVKFTYTLGITWTYGIDTVSPMRDFVEVWITGPQIEGWYHDQLADLHARGQEVWLCGGAPAIDQPPLAANWWPLLTWMRGLDGFMPSWLSLGWGEDPLTAPPENGRVTLLYPGARLGLDGPIASQRLKVMRNAMQTVEHFEVAAGRVGREAVEAAVNRALGLQGPGDWVSRRPPYAQERPPDQWINADFATEEPPLAGWQGRGPEAWRAIKAAAADLAAEPQRSKP